MEGHTEAEVVRDLAFDACKPTVVEPGKRYAWLSEDGTLTELDLTDHLPVRKAGTVTVRDVASLAAYWDKHRDDGSDVYADIPAATITGILDAHDAHAREVENDGARWQGHRVRLVLQPTLAWQAWKQYDGKLISQVDFAEFLEHNYGDLATATDYPPGIRYVSAADFKDIATRFTASTKIEFDFGHRTDSGDHELVFKETTQASSGRVKPVEIPREFCLAIAPYEDCQRALITARFRYRVVDGQLRLGYVLHQPDRYAEAAVKEIAGQVEAHVGIKVMLGTP